MKPSSLLIILSLGSGTILGASTLHAAIFVTTLTKQWDSSALVTGNDRSSIVFATDGSMYTLNGITLSVTENSAGSLTGELFLADGSNLPNGAALVSFSLGAFGAPGPGGLTDVSFTPTMPFTLDPSTPYVFALRAPTGSYELTGTGSGHGFDRPSGGTWDMPPAIPVSGDAGAHWVDFDAGAFRSRGAVDATVVPEPMHYGAVSALALLAFALLRRKSQRRSLETPLQDPLKPILRSRCRS